MNIHSFGFDYETFDPAEKLPAWIQAVWEAATKAAKGAYAPYSGFRVGAAVLLGNDSLVCGNNQENAAYPSGMCAERVALFAAMANHPGSKIKAVAVFALSAGGDKDFPVMPCGACRQVIAEYETINQGPVKVIAAAPGGKLFLFRSASDLLPLVFTKDRL